MRLCGYKAELPFFLESSFCFLPRTANYERWTARTVGTDHGHAKAMFVLGGKVKGGKVYGRWPGLENEQLNEGRDLALTTDFRQVLGEVVTHTLGAENMEMVFPGARLNRGSFLKLV